MGQDDDPHGPQPQIFSAVSDRCSNCHAKLATDQAYCLNCGQRRGKPRFAFSSLAIPAAAPLPPPLPPPRPRRPRISSSATLVTGIGTLILAMGVGVLIGEQGKTPRSTPVAAAPQIITVAGGGGAPAATASTAGARATSTHHKVKAKVKTVVITQKVAAKATQAAQSVLGGGGNIAPPTTKVGGSCSNSQAGCQGGQFTGNFFGQ
jgi:hypothetical protein